MPKFNAHFIARAIGRISEEEVAKRLGYEPRVWYFGGPNHNDYRLLCCPLDDELVEISDGNVKEIVDIENFAYIADMRAYVDEWLDRIMPAQSSQEEEGNKND